MERANAVEAGPDGAHAPLGLFLAPAIEHCGLSKE